MSWEFLLTSFVVVLLPGTCVIYTLAVGMGRGFHADDLHGFLGSQAGEFRMMKTSRCFSKPLRDLYSPSPLPAG